jgi:Tol biopolymer transport system component
MQVGGLDSAQSEQHVWLTADELTAYVSSARGGAIGSYDEWSATRSRATDAFNAPLNLPTVNSLGPDGRPALTADQLQIYFEAMPTTSTTNYDIYVATRADTNGPFGTPKPVAELNDPTDQDIAPWLVDDNTLYFASQRGGTSYDLYRTSRSGRGAPFETPTPIGELNTTSIETDPVVSADGLTIYFSSDRPGGAGDLDIWMATRATTNDGFGAATDVSELNTSAPEWPSRLSPDGCRLYFAGDRSGGSGGGDSDPAIDLPEWLTPAPRPYRRFQKLLTTIGET